ncbi:Mitochondrial carrier protein involved in the accumulation of CoA in the mitochondrial matrix [Komagataella phaffii GS115]|uniref:Mitochondrial carrier protein involved in the accumulation of CoA in the mitochondrial matrix n=1 Tax=Komagataella phaffii (strain GS115 / ATCC 20864) TaxID=644223 RepID=C4QVP1_KOMPG|nr:Mitochondrial carrier protein involved in the accumulation of CoA in the mitochondrial matrix [Komagataella phaffii GS115]CAY67314.1 Mitochondrial carrier protein involved in the accumulation of CoA in the mitochondrial matrix [Komagataella phaffii GS115]
MDKQIKPIIPVLGLRQEHQDSERSVSVSESPVSKMSQKLPLKLNNPKVIDKQSLQYVIYSGVAGGVAGSAAKTLIAPLDRVKILFQTANPEFSRFSGSFSGLFKAVRQIYGYDGVAGLYQGHSATLLRIFPYAAIKFLGFALLFFTYPLDLIRVRLAFETHREVNRARGGKFLGIVRRVFNEEPRFQVTALDTLARLGNFYRGFAPTIFGMIPYAGVSFYTHDLIHDVFRSRHLKGYTVQEEEFKTLEDLTVKTNSSHDRRLPLYVWAQLTAGGAAGMLAQAAAYPFEVIRRRMQVGAVTNNGEYLSILRTASQIYVENGARGFYVGLTIGFIKVVPMFACSFFVYERIKRRLGI